MEKASILTNVTLQEAYDSIRAFSCECGKRSIRPFKASTDRGITDYVECRCSACGKETYFEIYPGVGGPLCYGHIPMLERSEKW